MNWGGGGGGGGGGGDVKSELQSRQKQYPTLFTDAYMCHQA